MFIFFLFAIQDNGLMNVQVEHVQYVIEILGKQLKHLEDMIMFQTRILCKHLPKSIIDEYKRIEQIPLTKSHNDVNNKIKLRNEKRTILADQLEKFESDIESCEHLLQKESAKLIEEMAKVEHHCEPIMNDLNIYLNQKKIAAMNCMFYQETVFRYKLKYARHRRVPLEAKDFTDIYPEAIIECEENLFTYREREFLSSKGLYEFFLEHKWYIQSL